MIWVIGDIHGMFDPLKSLITKIIALSLRSKNRNIDKFIFIGDYIDYGPSSKEVIDYLMDLPFEKVFIMGNHDDLMLQFLDKSDLFEKYGNVWFRGNGGQKTVSSFFPDKYYFDSEEDILREDFPLDEKYISFFKNMKITHTEQLGNWNLAFSHAMLSPKFPIEEQLSIKTYHDFHNWRKEKKLWIEDTLMWSRDEPEKRFGDYILVHGHLPTPKLDRSWKNLHEYDPKMEMPFLKFETEAKPVSFYSKYSDIYGYTSTADKLISINTDTGAVYGNRLTAVGISEEMFDYSQIMVYQVAVSKGYRLSEYSYSYAITFHGF
ncbi:MAG: metallophosphoesterase [Desulfobacterales bacterium]|nr:metallophosphoesterase [Desulfobacterales bacterium]